MNTKGIELLGGLFRPITNTIGFFESTAEKAAEGFYSWKYRTYSRDGRELQLERIELDSLSELLNSMLPLTSRPCRWLFVETQSNWTAFFENWWRGTDPTAIAPLGGARLSCRSIRCTNIQSGDSPATILAVYKPTWTETGNTERSICAMKDGSSWTFEVSGEPYDFEQTDRYQERRKRDRFTPEMLDLYLNHFGISAFEESFYGKTKCIAYLVSISGPPLPNTIEYSLADLQGPPG